MSYRKYVYSLVSLYLYFTCRVTSADGGCDKSRCKGPLRYYEDLKCTPTYDEEDTCCPVKYNCDHLKERSGDKCYFNGIVYDVDENLRAEDMKPCDFECVCKRGVNDVAQFRCSVMIDCTIPPLGDDCYMKKSHNQCCDGPEICPQDEPEIARCEVDGKMYFDGQQFTPSSDPTLSCICAAGYTGENVSPFCEPVKPDTCDVELRFGAAIYNNCTPVFYSWHNPATDCNVYTRCQTNDDKVVKSKDETENKATPVSDPSLTCVFGQLTMKIGDQLTAGADYDTACLKCACEVPPLPTCQRLPQSECQGPTVLDTFLE